VKIHFYGFRVSFQRLVTTGDFFGYLGRQTGEIGFRGLDRILRVRTKGDVSNGVLLTVRDQKVFHELTRGSGGYSISQRTVGEGGLLEFNFFSFNHQSGCGLYQHYHHSLGLMAFGGFLKSQYQKHRHDLVMVDPKAKLKPPRGLDFSPIVRPQDFPALLKTLSKINKLKFTVGTMKDSGNVFSPLTAVANHAVHEVVFKKDPLSKIRAAVRDFIERGNAADVAVYGADEDGFEQILRLQGNLTRYHETDFDALVANAEFKLAAFESHPVSRELQRLMTEHDV